ncbi:hypothetical protein D5F01_LYC18468 [Larimichthys crocea]|uniref:Ig-like domain-containing protein n=1 Tax=Larimichthys crocea TaxID=215358 RepID=A0A6G0HVM8_LARCR|nr:hypothetical protein D5F01_LYC18468 [Larimichthys crocea]
MGDTALTFILLFLITLLFTIGTTAVKANSVDISDKQYVDLPEGPGLHSISRRFTVPPSQWKKDTSFTCKVNQGFSSNFESNSTGNIFVGPSVELLLVPSERSGPQRLLCSGWGFNPQIKWFTKSQQRSSSMDDISMGADGRVSVTSQLHIPQTEWKTGKVFTCEVSDRSLNENVRKDISLCSVSSSVPPSIHVEIPSFRTVMMAASEVKATCLVRTAFDAKVTWVMDGTVSTRNTVNRDTNTTHIISNVTVSLNQWKRLKQITCRVEHGCFSSTERTVNVAEPAVTAPSVEIRRSLPDLLKGNSAVLECDVTQLSSTDLYVTFQANSVDISDKQYVDLPEGPGLHSISRRFTVPPSQWKKDTSFTCKVNQGFSSNFESNSTGNIFVGPSVELLLVPSEESGPQRLLCSGWGFNPQIKWFTKSQQRSSSMDDISMGADGRVSVTSQLHIPQTEWKTGKVFICEVSDRSLNENVRKDISLCSEPAVTAPSVEIRRSLPDLLKGNSAVLECDVTQLSSTDLYVTFQANSVDISDKQYVDLPEGPGLHSISRRFTVPPSQWKKDTSFTCKVNQGFSSNFESNSTGNIFVGPSVELLLVPSEESGPQRLLCSGWGFNPQIKWFTKSQQRSSSMDDISMGADGCVSVTSQLHIPQTEWKTGKVFTCEVSDRSLNENVRKDISLCSEPAVTAPSVEIRRSLPDLLKGNSAVLECDVTQLSSTDLYVTFQANSVDISDKQYVDLPEGPGLHSISRRFTVPPSHWKKDTSFTCKVNQGFSSNFKSNSTGNIFVGPSVELLLVPSERSGPQRLLCSGWGFNPQIKWFTKSQQRSSSMDDISMGADGRVSVTSQLHIPQTEWKTGKVFTCEVSDRSLNKNVRKDISLCSEPAVTAPSVEIRRSLPDLLKGNSAVLECDVTQLSSTDLYVTFQANSVDISDKQYVDLPEGPGLHSISRRFTVPPSHWKKDTSFTCKVNQGFSSNFESNSTGNIFVGPSVELLLVPSERSGPQRLLCSGWGFNPQIKWFTKSQQRSSSMDDISMGADGRVSVTSQLHIPQTEWKTGKVFTCEVSDRSLNKNVRKDISLCSEPAVTAPSVEIRRSLPDLLKGNSAVLECDVTQLSSTDLYVTFQANSVDISDKQYVDLPEGPGLHSISRRFTVPPSHWKKDTSFTCKVNQGFSSNFESNSTGNIFVGPSVELLLVPSERSGPQRLSCSGWGFNPQIKWFTKSQQRSSSMDDISMGADGRVSVTSQLHIPQTEWKTGKVFTCEVSDRSLNENVRKDISLCSEPAVTAPSVEIRRSLPDLLKGNSAVLECDVTQLSSTDLYVTFQANSVDISDKQYVDLPEGPGLHSISRRFTVPPSHWKKDTSFTCKVNQGFSSNFESNSTGNIFVGPSVELLLVPSERSGPQRLSCSGWGFNPQIKWFTKSQQRSSSMDDISMGADGRVSVTSQLHIPQTEWKTGKVFTCEVSDRSLNENVRKDISLCSAKVNHSKPSATLLQGSDELVCLVFGFSPASINISWFLNDTKELLDYYTSEPHRGPNGKFSIQSHLRLTQIKRSPGAVVTCRVTHVNTTLSLNISKPDVLEDCRVFDTMHADVTPDVESWYMAFTFLLFFLIALLYGVLATIIKDENGHTLIEYSKSTDNGKKVINLALDITYDEWNQGIKRYCVVEHSEWLEPVKKIYERSIEFLIVTNYQWNNTLEIEDDKMRDTALAFILLFLITLLFTIGTTAVKDENGHTLIEYSKSTDNGKKVINLALDITYDEWNQGIKRYCVVEHSEWLEPVKKIYERSIEFLIVTNYQWNNTLEIEDDKMRDTALAFILLFLITLLFTIGTTAVKDENGHTLIEYSKSTDNGKKVINLALDITYDEWNQGIKRYCVVEHSEWLEPVKKIYERRTEFLIVTNYQWNNTLEIEDDKMRDTALAFILLFLITLLFTIGTTAVKIK